MYVAQKNHQPRSSLRTLSAERRIGSYQPSRLSASARGTVTRSISNTSARYGASVTRGIASNINAAPSPAAVQAATRSAAQRLASRMLGPVAIFAETINLANSIAETLGNMQVGYQPAGPAAGLVLATVRQHAAYPTATFIGTGDGVMRTTGFVLESKTEPNGAPPPDILVGYYPPSVLEKGTATKGPFVRHTIGMTQKRWGQTQQAYYGRFEYWYNPTGVTIPNPWQPAKEISVWPVPYGPVAPTIPMPVNRPRVRPRPRPRRVPQKAQIRDVTINLNPTSVSLVPNATPRPPQKTEREYKGSGLKGSAVATLAFYLWEASQDWSDWVAILVAGVGAPPSITGGTPQAQLDWLRQNPQAMLSIDAWKIISDSIGWAIDEAIGAQMGRISKGANRHFDAGSLDIKYNAGTWSAGDQSSIGATVADLLNSLL